MAHWTPAISGMLYKRAMLILLDSFLPRGLTPAIFHSLKLLGGGFRCLSCNKVNHQRTQRRYGTRTVLHSCQRCLYLELDYLYPPTAPVPVPALGTITANPQNNIKTLFYKKKQWRPAEQFGQHSAALFTSTTAFYSDYIFLGAAGQASVRQPHPHDSARGRSSCLLTSQPGCHLIQVSFSFGSGRRQRRQRRERPELRCLRIRSPTDIRIFPSPHIGLNPRAATEQAPQGKSIRWTLRYKGDDTTW
jgi:hypothetical protein